MKLVLYLKNKGRCTGPEAKHTSHSGMSNNMTILTGGRLFTGGEVFLHFGNALHCRFANDLAPFPVTLNTSDRFRIAAMQHALNKHVVVKRLTLNSVREKKLYTILNKVKITYILDVHQPHLKTGSDLKTTECQTLEECIDSCRKYRYFAQAVTYMKAEKLTNFYFIFIQKSKPHRIFIVDVLQYPEDLRYAECELAFTLYLKNHYGSFKENKKEDCPREAAPINGQLRPLNGTVHGFKRPKGKAQG